ncbi:MAG TPA: S-methyl-5-thioribose-1-phosphate isomerase [Acidimicrobiia bacterium]|nr:S-methyl-5-thioribose-1-phosphate isomerase [Acidimicrobiia bacterium]
MDRLGARSLDWIEDAVVLVDQTRLPGSFETLRIDDVPAMVAAIQRLSVRGAPAIGVAGAFGVALAVRDHGATGEAFESAVTSLRAARPTAVNLARMVDRTSALAAEGFERVLAEAMKIRDEELAASVAMGDLGADLVSDLIGDVPVVAMTICNTGGLATVERGTALAVIQTLHERGQLTEALALETRPLLQGARLTTWELGRMGAPHRLVVDSAGPFLLSRGAANIVLTGADRIAANGDTANKIGTYSLALGAARAGVPFVVVAPETTVDMATAAGGYIEIEDRGPAEVGSVAGVETAPAGTDAVNPAFDVTPADLITAIVTDRRVIRIDKGETLATVPLGPVDGQSNRNGQERGST